MVHSDCFVILQEGLGFELYSVDSMVAFGYVTVTVVTGTPEIRVMPSQVFTVVVRSGLFHQVTDSLEWIV